MKVKTLFSSAATVDEVAIDFKNQLGSFNTKLFIFFASTKYDSSISGKINELFPQCDVIGSTTSGEIVSGKMVDNSVVGMAFSSELFEDYKIEVLRNIKQDDGQVEKAFSSFENHFGLPMEKLDPAKFLGLVLIDGLSGCEEKINERIGDLTGLPFVGGSTGDDLKFEKTLLYVNGKTYENAAVLLLTKPKGRFEILKTQSFEVTNTVLTVTETVEEDRLIIALNGKPASRAYAEALGIPEEELSDKMFRSPLGLMLGDNEPFVRSPQRVDGSNIYFYCNVKEGTDLHLLKSTDIVRETQRVLKEKEEALGKISAVINFNCILRTLDLKQQNRTQEYADLFLKYPTVGFSTYGESYIGHINQTATMVLFN